MENRIVLFSNIKGGVGKTTLCAFLQAISQRKAYQYLQWMQTCKHPCTVTDSVRRMLIQIHLLHGLLRCWTPQTGRNWRRPSANLRAFLIVLIDCPGNLNDRNLEHIYKAADVAVIPMSFDADTVDATGIFIKAFKTISNAKLLFAPNRINTSEGKAEELRQRTQTTEFLGLVGTVLPRIKQSVVVKRYTTLYPLERNQNSAVESTFETIIQELNIK